MVSSAAQAADLIIADPVVDMASPTDHDAYIGVLGSVGNDGTPYGGIGVVIGVDVDVSDVVFVGADARAEAYFNATGYSGVEGAIRGRVGFHATEGADLYLAAGVGGFVPTAGASFGFYEVAVGAEFDVADDLAIRTELAGTGPFGAGFNAVQVNLGLLWQF